MGGPVDRCGTREQVRTEANSAPLYGDMTSPRETQQVGKTMELGRGQKPPRKTEGERSSRRLKWPRRLEHKRDQGEGEPCVTHS